MEKVSSSPLNTEKLRLLDNGQSFQTFKTTSIPFKTDTNLPLNRGMNNNGDCYRRSAQNDSFFSENYTLSLRVPTLLCVSVVFRAAVRNTKTKQYNQLQWLAGLFLFICRAYILTFHKKLY